MATEQYTNINTVRLCPSCSTSLMIEDAHFCGHCGHHLSAEEAHSASAQTVHSLPKPVLAHRRFTLFSVLSTLTIVILAVSLILEWFDILPHISSPTPSSTPGPVMPQNCGGAVSDGFHGSLDSRWQWVNPSGSATYSTAQGYFSLSAPPNSDLYPRYNNFSAPRLLQPINGDFTLSTLVSFSPNTNYQSAGLLLWQDQTTFLRLEIAFGLSKKRGVTFQHDGQPLSTMDQHPTTAKSIELSIQKQGDHFTAWWRVPGQNWQSAGETDLHFKNLMVGLDLIADYSAPRTTASYDYFMVSCS